jgi:hypothetical protein
MCHEVPKIYDTNVISAFWSGMNYQTLVHELSCDQPKTTKELLDITTKHASSKEAVGAVFIQSNGKAAPGGGRGAPPKITNKGTNKRGKWDKRGLKRWPQWVAVTTSYDKGDKDKNVGDSDEELIATTKCDVKR